MRGLPRRARRVLIVARSGRMLADAARAAGWQPWVIDQFADEDTRHLAAGVLPVAGTALGFDHEVLDAVATIIGRQGSMPIVLGAGFEDAAPLVAALSAAYPVIGCDADVIAALAQRTDALVRIRDSEVRVPVTLVQRPLHRRGWLVKRNGACGGQHVRRLETCAMGPADPDLYYQQRIEGVSMSATFLANAKRCELCAVFEHLRWHSEQLDPYRYEGAQCLATAAPELLEQAHAIGSAVAREFGMRGCFGLDFIYTHAGALYLVDINPRPPATLDLLADRAQIFAAHLASGGRGELLYSRPRARAASAHIVLYAEHPWAVTRDMRWPAWTADRPAQGTLIARDAPLCTVRASTQSRVRARAELSSRFNLLRTITGASSNAPLPDTLNVKTMGDPGYGYA